MKAAEILTAAGLTAAATGGRNRVAAAAAGVAMVTSSALTRFGIFYAGRTSARDPRYTIGPQKDRIRQPERGEPSSDGGPSGVRA